MSAPLVSIFISSGSVVLLFLLFRFEEHRGRRIGSGLRIAFDRGVERFDASIRMGFQTLERDLLRQVLHYVFHKILRLSQAFLKEIEARINNLLRVNRAMARRAFEERATRTKLDEIAAHKASVALSPKERKAQKEKSIGTKL